MTREQSFRDLVAWQKAMALAEAVYRESQSWPDEEKFGLTSQIRRAAASVPANIAEGSGRTGSNELRRFLSIAHGSLCEEQTHFEVACRLGFTSGMPAENIANQAEEVSRIIRGFVRSLD